MRSEERVGGGNPQPTTLNQLNNHPALRIFCELTQSDRNSFQNRGMEQ